MSTKRTITLTNRPPVTIVEDDWPVIASSRDSWHDGQYEFQAFEKTKWNLVVRQHEDQRTLVYATYNFSTAWQGRRDFNVRHGVLLIPGENLEDQIIQALHQVVDSMVRCEHHGEDADRWASLLNECIADLPAEELT